MLDLDLLRSFVSVVESGGFTRAGERVHRTQSTVSQQIKRLEDDFGRPLLHRNGKSVTPTEDGERLLSYARRILSLAEEARDALARPTAEGAVRLGIPEDFAAYRLTKLLASFARSRPGIRLDVRADQSTYLRRDLERGDIDLALLKRDAGESGGIAVWPERVHWVTSKIEPDRHQSTVVAADLFPDGLPLPHHGPFTRSNPRGATGIWPTPAPACPAFRLRSLQDSGFSILPQIAIQKDHQTLSAKDGFAPIDKTEVALVASPTANAATLRLADRLAEFCSEVQAKAA